MRASQALFQRASQSIPGGVNSPVRAFKSVGLTPLFIERGKGSKIYDADGNGYIDYVGSWGPLILGHANEAILEAVIAALRQGTSFGAPTEKEVVLAELVKELVPSVERVRFTNSGNEAVQGALRVARGFTKRDKIIKFAGCYHGSLDALLVKAGSGATTLGVPDSAGVPQGMVATTLIAEYNDLQAVIDLIDENPGEIAGIIVEGIPGNMGVIPPDLTFMQGLRDLCDREGILLIMDEVMTGFRVALGGAQALFEITPDISIFGKVIGGGFPVGAYGARAEIMEKLAPLGPVYQAGTLSGNPVAMAAGIATLNTLRQSDPFRDLDAKAQRLMAGLQAAGQASGHPLQVCHFGAMMGMFFSAKPVRNYTDALATDVTTFVKFFQGMLREGVYLAPSAFEALFISTAHTDADVDHTIAAAKRVLNAL
ncbi:MAG TPA: glutamate-1-semialdehyde 2,1-aminomutase [bacterium]